MKRWDSELYGKDGKCWRCRDSIAEDARIYFSGPNREPVHAECEAKAVARTPTTAGEIFEVLGKAAHNVPAVAILRISNMDLAKEVARSWLVANGVAGEGSAKVFDNYNQSLSYEVTLNQERQLFEPLPPKVSD